ncbi:MAG TPA: PIG-L deacetylase family protein [Clostridia bacterium]|nr:PIG-L deacetylase family protein [Clostridia bacterium]
MAFFKCKKNLVAAIDKVLPNEGLLGFIAPLPNLDKAKRVLFIGPHPDDIEIGAGATLNKFIKAGKAVKMVICTDGGSGSADTSLTCEKISATRLDEANASAKVFGLDGVLNLGYPDGGVYSENELAEKLAQVIYDFEPDLILCPDPYLPNETHPDHLKCGRATATAVTIASFYFSAKRHGLDFDPKKIIAMRTLAYYYTHRANVFVKVSEEDTTARLNGLKCHKSQMSEGLAEGLALYLSLRDSAMGKKASGKLENEEEGKIKTAEGFFAMGPLHQHCVSEVNFF